MNDTSLVSNPLVLVLFGALGGMLILWVKKQAELATYRANRSDETADVVRRTQLTQIGAGEALKAQVALLMEDRARCEQLAAEVAVLKDHKLKAELKHDQIDGAMADVRLLTHQMAQVVKAWEAMPETISNVLADKLPKAILDTMAAARAAPLRQVHNG